MVSNTSFWSRERYGWWLRASGCVFGLLWAVCSINGLCAADWPTYRSDMARSGTTADVLPHALSLRWTYKSMHVPKPAWPSPSEELPRMHSDNAFHTAISQGTVYFGCSVTNRVLAVDATSGNVRWTFYAEGPVRFAPTVSAGRVYFGSDDGYVYCLDAAAGTLIWKRRAGASDEKVLGNGRMISLWPVRTSVLVDSGVVYFAAGVFPYEGLYIYALKAEDGSVVWVNDTIGDRAHELEFGGISPHGYLVASSQSLYVPSGRAMPAAFDRAGGKFQFFVSPGGKRGGVWTLLDNNRLIAGVDSSGTPIKAAYDAATGAQQEDAFAWFAGTDMAVTPEVVYLVNADGVYAVDRRSYASAVEEAKLLDVQRQESEGRLAELKKEPTDSTPPPNADELARRTEEHARKLAQVTARRGQLRDSAYLWRYSGQQFTAVIHAGNVVLAGGPGIVVGLDPVSGQEAWRHEVDGVAVGLAVAEGRLVVSTDTGGVYCFGEGMGAARTLGSARVENPYPDDALTESYRAAARTILEETGISKGVCLVLDAGEGRLAYELARQTDLQIVGIERNAGKLAVARSRLEDAGLWGSRVVVESWDLSSLPDYFAKLIVSDGMLHTGQITVASEERQRVLRPWGGTEYLSFRESGAMVWKRSTRGPLEGAGDWTQQFADPHNTSCSQDELVRGPLGILWYGEPGPQGMVERHASAQAPVALAGRLFIQGEHLIRAVDAFNGTLLWERSIPGAVRVNVKGDSGNLVATETGLYIAALDKCYRLDPATGQTMRVFELPASSPSARHRWGYVSVVGNVLYGSTATAMQHEYGALLAAFLDNGQWRNAADVPADLQSEYERFKQLHPDPQDLLRAAQRSGYMYWNMIRFPQGGEFTQENAVTSSMMVSDRVFAIDTETGKLLWEYEGQRIANITVVLGDGQIFLTESAVTAEQRNAAIAARKQLEQSGIYHVREHILEELAEKKQVREEYLQQKQALVDAQGDPRQLENLISQVQYLIDSLESELFKEEDAAGRLSYDDADVRVVVALNASTGDRLWERVVDLTGCGGDHMGAAFSDGLLLFFGNHGNHDAWRFGQGGMKWRRITALAAPSGDMVWSRPLNYRTRPVIVGEKIILEPRACDLHTGETVMREHPITGQAVPWEFLRPGHTCGVTAASAEGLFYRSACTAFYDLARDNGVTIFGGYRPGCAISVIPACGLLLSPEAAAGCTCSYPIRCTWAMKRKPQRQQPWSVYVTPGALSPVKHLALNLGAVADMKDDEGTVWFAYPSPNTAKHTHFPNYGVKLALQEEILPGAGYFSRDFKGRSIVGTEKPWLFTSGCRGLVRCQLPLVAADSEQSAGSYDVRLGFLAPEGDVVGQRVFDIQLQGKVVQQNCDLTQLAGGIDQAIVLEFADILVSSSLLLELTPHGSPTTDATAPVIHFIEVCRNP
ncbi:MAG: outer membrane protein assembly factor BamB family protein [Pirellulaceae bacterium]